ncbi:MAG: hypothetical protein GF353_13925, partial [Candidatus Lokiarchaeota archaeon]|nr:hypothetical protein [Candidatus Lokiarchaeota archaeon]
MKTINRFFYILLILQIPINFAFGLYGQDIDTEEKAKSSSIQAAEYFIDTDPGKGNGHQLTATDGNFDSSSESISLNLNTANLSKGNHYVFIRFKSAEGIWGNARGGSINIGTSNVERHINTAEYYIDSDPGFGKGMSLTCNDGQFDEKIEELEKIAVGTTDLSPGQHKLFVRAQASDGAWGESISRTFLVSLPDIPPSIPQNFEAIASDKKIELSWSINNEPDLSHYKIYRDQNQGFTPTESSLLTTVSKSASDYIDLDVINDQTYYYRISA